MSSASAAFEIKTEPVPLRVDAEGVVRVGGTRVTLDSVVWGFTDGQTPEQVVQDFPTLKLADVYAVFAYYLNHRADVDRYVAECQRMALEATRLNEAQHPELVGIRERLLARREEQRASTAGD